MSRHESSLSAISASNTFAEPAAVAFPPALRPEERPGNDEEAADGNYDDGIFPLSSNDTRGRSRETRGEPDDDPEGLVG
jgi:hypothetical protein